ncbi:uncharacterized protein K452DRAFT_347510 [Aplosporella prunicola CBS 121167]|uniref:Uncharacterized protein n=1 Tax=Aplosporella prunicola CBS 121167 TaxID=1176127 RepID=A0A6A6AXV7_9PEZI|nr:uncharacterized protein K452DRAFT_347510 [Aplosporella prunicola CBS 121167]KAF2135607.1 hypothetical protein K452DRAFT_347510 [Aplosporella prunicola CBS 121167]
MHGHETPQDNHNDMETHWQLATQPAQAASELDPGTQAIVAAINSLRDTVKTEISGLRDEIADLRYDITGLRDDVTGLQDDVADSYDNTNVRVGCLRVDIAGLRNEVKGLRAEVSECESSGQKFHPKSKLLTNGQNHDDVKELLQKETQDVDGQTR